MDLDKKDIARIRRKAYRHGCRVEKSRGRTYHSNNQGGLMLIEGYTNSPLAGWNFELDVSTAEYWIDRYAAEGRGFPSAKLSAA